PLQPAGRAGNDLACDREASKRRTDERSERKIERKRGRYRFGSMSQGFMSGLLEMCGADVTAERSFTGYEFRTAHVTCQACYTGYHERTGTTAESTRPGRRASRPRLREYGELLDRWRTGRGVPADLQGRSRLAPGNRHDRVQKPAGLEQESAQSSGSCDGEGNRPAQSHAGPVSRGRHREASVTTFPRPAERGYPGSGPLAPPRRPH